MQSSWPTVRVRLPQVDRPLAARWTSKAEYLHVNRGSQSITETATAPFSSNPHCSTFNVNFGRTNLDVIRVGLNFRL